jgi:hypothetical protein
MTLSNWSKAELADAFEKFQALDPVRDDKARKDMVHRMEAAVKTNEISIPNDDAQSYLHSELELARILVYLLIENAKLNSDLLARRGNVLSEWERLRRNLSHEVSRMPMYYAVRAYLVLLRAAPDMRAKARDDSALVREIQSSLSQSPIDRRSALLDRISELLYVIAGEEAASSNPAIVAAFIQRRGTLLAALIAAVVAIALAVIVNWDKLTFFHGGPPTSATQQKP